MAYVTGRNSIDSLIAGEGWRWNRDQAYGTAANVTFSFMEAAPSYATTGDHNGFRAMSETERAASRRALAVWSEVANIPLLETADSNDGGQIRLGTNTQSGSSAYTYLPTGTGNWSGDIYLNNASASNQGDFADGSYGFMTLVHEIGHALGLKHPGAYDSGGNVLPGPYLPTAEDNRDYSVMSYKATSSGVSPLGPMIYDIAAVQFLYGANGATRAGDDVYGAGAARTIWDAGGQDTIDGSAFGGGVTIDLAEGAFSDLGASRDLAIASGAVIENATGGAGADRLIGNGAANVLAGGEGDDTLIGGDRDTLDGGGGSDRVEIGGSVSVASAETIVGSSGGDWLDLGARGNALTVRDVETLIGGAGADIVTLGGGGAILLTAVETLIGGGDPDIVELGKRGNTMAVSLVETLNGGAGGDWITIAGTIHLSGIETVIGGAGMDAVGLGDGGNALIMAAVETLTGGAGIDRVSLGARGGTVLVRGVETLIGGTGADVVAFRDGAPVWFQGGAGADTVYAPATDGLWLNWSDAADGADSVVDFAEARGVLSFGGALAAAADKNGDGFLSLTRRATGAADGRTDEVVRLEQRVGQLSGDGFASFRQALGQLAPGRAAPMLALADDGASTGLYFVGERISLLARFEGALLQRPHLALAG